MSTLRSITKPDRQNLAKQIIQWGQALGFQQIGITDIDLTRAESDFQRWLDKKFHGEMHYMLSHGRKRSRPEELVPGTLTVISARMNYLPEPIEYSQRLLEKPEKAYISRYALGRDYHKMLRKRLQRLCDQIEARIGDFGYRVFVDSAPVLEKPLAEKAGLGWIGKHTNLLNQQASSWFFLGEIYTDLPLPINQKHAENRCGSCQACIDVCPTKAIVAPYQLDARRCISYLTIELRGSIPERFRAMIGNRIYGCDDCQLVCPWNRFAKLSIEADFKPRYGLDDVALVKLFSWTEQTFRKNTEGSAIRRIGYDCWLRNIAVALGNAPTSLAIVNALKARRNHSSALVREHVNWALIQHSKWIL